MQAATTHHELNARPVSSHVSRQTSIILSLAWDGKFRKVKVKGKVIPVLFFLTEHHALKAYWGVDV